MSMYNRGTLLSVIIPCFNHGKFILETLESVENSSYDNIEVIIVDDGSTEFSTIQILKRIEKDVYIKNKKVKVFFQSNKGPSAARNLAITHAKGKFILPLDADDKIDPNYIYKAISILNSNDSIGFVYPGVMHFGLDSHSYLPKNYDYLKLLFRNYIVVSGIYRKRDWERVNGYDENIKGFEDWDFWIKLGGLGVQGYALKEIMLFYRQSNNSKGKKDKKKFRENKAEVKRNNYFLYSEAFKKYKVKYVYTLIFETLFEFISNIKNVLKNSLRHLRNY